MANFRKKNLKQERRIDAIFCMTILLIPTLQFIIFYLGVHFNSLLLAFRSYENGKPVFAGLKNIKKVLDSLTTDDRMVFGLKNSLKLYLIDLVIGVSLTVLFSYSIFKKTKGYGFMRVMLFLPSIISPIVMVIIFQKFSNVAIPSFMQKVFNVETPKNYRLLDNDATKLATLIFYTIWVSFGAKILLYSGAMSGINEAVIEAAKIDGANNFQELWKIVIPLIFPTLSTFIVVGIAGLFTNQMSLFSFYGIQNIKYEYYTLGYYLFRSATELGTSSLVGYPELAALGVCISIVVIPLTFLVRFLLEKLGPKVE